MFSDLAYAIPYYVIMQGILISYLPFDSKSGMLQALPQFYNCESERPYTHLKDFEDAYSIFKDNSCPREVLLLKLFLFTLKDKGKLWFNSLRLKSIYS